MLARSRTSYRIHLKTLFKSWHGRPQIGHIRASGATSSRKCNRILIGAPCAVASAQVVPAFALISTWLKHSGRNPGTPALPKGVERRSSTKRRKYIRRPKPKSRDLPMSKETLESLKRYPAVLQHTIGT